MGPKGEKLARQDRDAENDEYQADDEPNRVCALGHAAVMLLAKIARSFYGNGGPLWGQEELE